MSAQIPVTPTWQLVATPTGWEYLCEPGARVVAWLRLTTEQAWRLLTNNLPAAGQSRLTASGDNEITGILLRILQWRVCRWRLLVSVAGERSAR